MGLCPETDAFWEHLTGLQFVTALLRFTGYDEAECRHRAENALHQVELLDAKDRKIGGYSKGMRQRVKLAQAIAHDPEVLLLDEPVSGMDPVNRRRVIDLVRKLGREGKTVVVSSHILYEVEAMTKRVLLVHNGRILAEGDVREIRDLLDEHPHTVALRARDPRRLAAGDRGLAERALGDASAGKGSGSRSRPPARTSSTGRSTRPPSRRGSSRCTRPTRTWSRSSSTWWRDEGHEPAAAVRDRGAGGLRPLARGDGLEAPQPPDGASCWRLPVRRSRSCTAWCSRAKPPAQLARLDLYAVVVAVYWVRNVLPLAALFYATALIADEVEGKTLTYLVTRPLTRALDPRRQVRGLPRDDAQPRPARGRPDVLHPRERARRATGARRRGGRPLPRPRAWWPSTLVAYGAFFALLGVLLKRPVIPGLLFLFGWELLANLPGLPAALHPHRVAALAHPPPAGRGGPGRPLPAGAPGRAGPGRARRRFGGLPRRRRLDLFHPRVRSRPVKGPDWPLGGLP